MKTLAEEMMAIGLSGIRPENVEPPMLTTEDVDLYAEEYVRALNKAQALLGYRPYNVETGEAF